MTFKNFSKVLLFITTLLFAASGQSKSFAHEDAAAIYRALGVEVEHENVGRHLDIYRKNLNGLACKETVDSHPTSGPFRLSKITYICYLNDDISDVDFEEIYLNLFVPEKDGVKKLGSWIFDLHSEERVYKALSTKRF